jgi:hypothetical protein
MIVPTAATSVMAATTPPPEDAACDGTHGWVVPDGRFYACASGQHAALALRLLLAEGQRPADPALAAERRGWLKIGHDHRTGRPIARCGRKPTPAQEATLWRWCGRHDVSIRQMDPAA